VQAYNVNKGCQSSCHTTNSSYGELGIQSTRRRHRN